LEGTPSKDATVAATTKSGSRPAGDGADAGAGTDAESIYLRREGAALGHVLTLHPAHLRLPESCSRWWGRRRTSPKRGEYEEALKELIRAGLLFEAGGLIVPTLAALRFNKLIQAGTVS
jgi:hypothetical protein